MPEVKLTKNELRSQQTRLAQLQRYLPTLQLKKAMLQLEVQEARVEIVQLKTEQQSLRQAAESWAQLLSEKTSVDPVKATTVTSVKKRYENIAGVEVPYYEDIVFDELSYSLFDTPPWVDSAIIGLRGLSVASAKIIVVQEKKAALEKELREVSIRVNLFEKILIPRSLRNIKTIKVFLGDQQLAAVSQAKVAKNKIEAHKLAVKMAAKAKK